MASRILSLLLCITSMSCSGGGSSTSSIPTAPWPKFRHDGGNTGIGSAAIGNEPLTIRWQYPPASEPPLNAPISASPAIGADGTIYVATEGGELLAFSQDGTLKWRVPEAIPDTPCHPAAIRSSPAVTVAASNLPASDANDKILFFGADDGHVYAVQDRAEGPQCLWAFSPPTEDPPSPIVSSPTFIIDSVEEIVTGIFVGSTSGIFYALNRNGSLKWQYPPAGQPPLGAITSSPAMEFGGPIYFTSADGNLYALTNDGALGFVRPLGVVSSTFASSPARGTSIYVATEDGTVLALNIDGSLRWQFMVPAAESIVASPALGVRGVEVPTPAPGEPFPNPARTTIFVVGRAGTIYALDDTSGQPDPDFTIAPAGATTSSPAISGDGCLVLGDDDGMLNTRRLEAIAPTTPTPTTSSNCIDQTVLLAEELGTTFAIRSSPAIDSDGVIYVGADNGRVYAIGGPS